MYVRRESTSMRKIPARAFEHRPNTVTGGPGSTSSLARQPCSRATDLRADTIGGTGDSTEGARPDLEGVRRSAHCRERPVTYRPARVDVRYEDPSRRIDGESTTYANRVASRRRHEQRSSGSNVPRPIDAPKGAAATTTCGSQASRLSTDVTPWPWRAYADPSGLSGSGIRTVARPTVRECGPELLDALGRGYVRAGRRGGVFGTDLAAMDAASGPVSPGGEDVAVAIGTASERRKRSPG